MQRNIELKARLKSLGAARAIAQRLATDYLGIQEQTDTYFPVARGRLKLREIAGQQAYLVWYQRADKSEQKGSDYLLTPADDPGSLKQSLTSALGQLQVVRKHREIFLWHNVRIHLDRLEDGREFLEFEAVLGSHHSDAEGHDQLRQLSAEFNIQPADLIAGSYADIGDGL